MSVEHKSTFSRRDFVQLLAAGTVPVMSGGTAWQHHNSDISDKLSRHRRNKTWPVLTSYREEKLRRIALPLGGIGTGTVSLGGRGDFRDWEIMNRPAKGFSPEHTFFSLWAKAGHGKPVARVLEGPIPPEDYEGAFGSRIPNHGLPRFDAAEFLAAYPLGQVLLEDEDVPLQVRIEAFNPLVPADTEASGYPVAIVRFILENPGPDSVDAAISGNLQNFIGEDGSRGKPDRNCITYVEEAGLKGLNMFTEGVDRTSEQWGTMALATADPAEVSHLTSWGGNRSWNTRITDFWDDFIADGRLVERDSGTTDGPIGSLCIRDVIGPGETKEMTFIFAWHFPNRQSWTPEDAGEQPTTCDEPGGTCCDNIPNCVGNHYTTRFLDAWDAAHKVTGELEELEASTLAFVGTFCLSNLPQAVKEAALNNVSTLRSQTTFRIADGRFFGFEGCHPDRGCCHGSCTHVWNYEQATAFLFGELATSLRDTEFDLATNDQGLMSFRVNLPLDRSQGFGKAAADGQMGCLLKLYRDWQLSGDDDLLRRLWPKAKRALSFAWIKGGWDADRDGVMEGAQHNTMDVEYFGPNPQMQAWYLGALRAGEEMARYLGDTAFADQCRSIFESGKQWTDANLFNGEYYEHEIRPPMSADQVAPSLLVGMGSDELGSPDFQLGSGCLVDQLVGQFLAHVCGLGYLLNSDNVKTTLSSIMRYNFKEDLSDHFNNMRTFALGKENGLLMATYPRGDRPERPFPYYNEIMTGFEYAAAVHMLYEGQIDDGLEAIKAIRSRYDGEKRNPFNEAECGNHYARAMASWGAVLALTGFHYSAVDARMTFAKAGEEVVWFWSTGYAWGTCAQHPDDLRLDLQVLFGTLNLEEVVVTGSGTARLPDRKTMEAGETIQLTVS